MGVGDRVRLVGWLDRDEVLRFLSETDIFLAPCVTCSSGDQETGPVVLMEAMASGLPVLTTYHTGIPEFVRDGENGFVVPERDADAIADRLVYLSTHQEVWPDLGEQAKRRICQHHDLHKQIDDLVEIYRTILQGALPPQDIEQLSGVSTGNMAVQASKSNGPKLTEAAS